MYMECGGDTLFLSAAAFYYSLGNIPPHYRSTLWNIQLLAITTSPILQKYGPDRILEPIMKDIKMLEQVRNFKLLTLVDNL